MIKAIIFDLDNCIFDTSSMGGRAIQGVKDALASSDLSEENKLLIGQALKTDPLEDALSRFGVPLHTAEAMRAAYRESDVPADCVVCTYGDEDVIKQMSVLKILVTSGYKKFQSAKIARLGIAGLFDQIVIDVLDVPADRKGKVKIFEELLSDHGLLTSEVLVVGDNPRSELGAAKELGLVAVQTLRPGVERWDDADHHISHLQELLPLIK